MAASRKSRSGTASSAPRKWLRSTLRLQPRAGRRRLPPGRLAAKAAHCFPNTAKVQLEGANGPMPLKPEEKIAFLFASAVQGIESDCQFQLKRTCNMAEVLGGAAANGQKTGHLKYDPRTDPNYTYTVGALDMAWDVHATPKKPGLMGFYIWSRGLGGAHHRL